MYSHVLSFAEKIKISFGIVQSINLFYCDILQDFDIKIMTCILKWIIQKVLNGLLIY